MKSENKVYVGLYYISLIYLLSAFNIFWPFIQLQITKPESNYQLQASYKYTKGDKIVHLYGLLLLQPVILHQHR